MPPEGRRLRGETGTLGILEGTVAFGAVAPGSHQAHDGPWVRTDDGLEARVYAAGDNPFEHATFRALSGARVRVEGVWQNGVLRVEPTGLRVLGGSA